MKARVVSFSELDTARQCLFKHELAYKQRWRAPTTGPALARGTAWHGMMEAHYEVLKTWGAVANNPLAITVPSREVAWVQAGLAAVQWLRTESGMSDDEKDLLEWMYAGYRERWEGEDWGIAPRTRVLAVEHSPEVWLPTDRGGRSGYKLKLKIDLVVLVDGKMWLVDHKSGKDLPSQKMLDIDDQFGLYTWAMRKLGKQVFGSVHNAARTQRNKDQKKHPQPLEERFRRTQLYRTDTELDHLAVDAWRYARIAWSQKVGEAPRSPNADTCKWRCDFTEPCLAGRKGIDHEAMLLDMGFTQDPTRH